MRFKLSILHSFENMVIELLMEERSGNFLGLRNRIGNNQKLPGGFMMINKKIIKLRMCDS